MSKILDFLKKIGVIKAGSSSWKGNAKDQKTSDVLDDFYDNDSDSELEKDDDEE